MMGEPFGATPQDFTYPVVPSSRRLLGAVIRVLEAPSEPSTFRLVNGSCIVGSSSTSDLVIHDPAVSRRHVELSVVPGGVAVNDLQSRNGTFYLGQRVDRMTLSLGAMLQVGSARLVIDPDFEALRSATVASDSYRGLLGTSRAMRSLFGTMMLLEGSSLTVHVTGESGVGKELVARALHEGSGLRGPIVALNCGAVSRDLVTSELFGHRRGAFTGAIEARRGAFECAEGGTLFLDEIAELPLDVQPMLLRAIETGEVRPLGGDRVERVNVRIVSATHRDLEAEVRAGRFREDLYYRLAVIRVAVPPLRERPDDIEHLARGFATQAGIDLSDDALRELRRRTWPGNVRELKNAVQAYSVLRALPPSSSTRDARTEDALVAFVRTLDVERSYAELKDDLLDRFQEAYLKQLLARTGGNQTKAAQLSGLDRTYLGRLLAKYTPRT